MITFPTVSGSNLAGRKFQLPHDLDGKLNLLLIAFRQHQQRDIDTWLPLAQKLADVNPAIRYYELPVIRSMNFLSRAFIDGGMRAGIPDQNARAATITLYLDKRPFRRALDIPDEDSIYILLVDKAGNVLWRTNGRFHEDKAYDLIETINERIRQPETAVAAP